MRQFGILLLGAVLLAGCSTSEVRIAHTVTLVPATETIPEAQLLDVAVVIFDPGVPDGEIDKEVLEDLLRNGTFVHIRRTEARFMTVHLRDTLQKSGHWGAVWVTPGEALVADLQITAEILHSDGDRVELAVQADLLGQPSGAYRGSALIVPRNDLRWDGHRRNDLGRGRGAESESEAKGEAESEAEGDHLFLVSSRRVRPQNRGDDAARAVDSGHENLTDVSRLARAGVESEDCRKILTARVERIAQGRVHVSGSYPDEVNGREELGSAAFPRRKKK